MTNSLCVTPPLADHAAPTWADGQLNGIAAAPGLPKPVRDLIGDHTRTFFAYLQARSAARTAEQAATRAGIVDAQNRAAAIAGGAPAPADQHPDAQSAAEQARQAEQDHLAALATIETRIKTSIAANAHKWLQVIDDEDAQLRDDCLRLADQIRDHFTRRAQLAAIRLQVADPHRGKVWGAFARGAASIRTDNAITSALDTLRAYSGADVRPPGQTTLGHL